MLRYFQYRLMVVSFYITLDVVVASLAYLASYGEPNFTPGQLMMRMLGAMLMANGLIGGPDTMMFWQESGRRAKAESERDAVAAELEKTRKEREQEAAAAVKEREQAVANAVKEAHRSASAQAEQERAALEQRLAEQGQEMQTLRAQIAELQAERRPRRRARRRPLRDASAD